MIFFKIHLAENLISNHTNKKWKTKDVGEKSAYVILEMSESYQIVGIDIGNEHSAFVEVLVGKSTCAPQDFKEILLTCSFMTPLESKSSNNINRVRCFSRDALVPDVKDNKWSLVKIVCTQPFNKHVQYGLSFIKFHVQENQKPKDVGTHVNNLSDKCPSLADNTIATTDNVHNARKLKFREDSPESEIDENPSLFNRWKKFKNEESSTPTINNKDSTFQQRFSDTQSTSKAGSKKLGTLCFEEENLNKRKQFECLSNNTKGFKEKRCTETIKITENKTGPRNDTKSMEISIPFKTDTIDHTSKNLNKHKLQEKKVIGVKTEKKVALFNELLKNVVFVISGIQNPERSDLRNKALAMGARYKGDWDGTCTHLICAFKNTPKYNQVKGKGKIVSPRWITKCYSLRKYLPWRRYALDSDELNKQESDEEVTAEPSQHSTENLNNGKDMFSSATIKEQKSESSNSSAALGIYDVDDRHKVDSMSNGESISDCDTDDEIKKVEESLKINKRDIYDASTDEDDYLKEKYSQMQNISDP